MPASRLRAYGEDGNLVHEMDMPKSGPAEFTTEKRVSTVVFYEGDPDTETVIGTQDIGKAGAHSVFDPTNPPARDEEA